MKKLIIFGGSGIGMIAASIAEDLGYYQVLGFLNDDICTGDKVGKHKSYSVLGDTEAYRSYLNDPNIEFIIAYVGMQNEKSVYEKIDKFEIPLERYATLIHPTAIIPNGMCRIGRGVLMAPLAQVSPDTTIQDNCILLANCMIGHDSTLSRFVHVATNAVVGSNVVIGKSVHVGSNATIREKVHIGDFSLIGSGSVVLQDVGLNSIVAGNPARILRVKG